VTRSARAATERSLADSIEGHVARLHDLREGVRREIDELSTRKSKTGIGQLRLELTRLGRASDKLLLALYYLARNP
jgi:hypothetical protein